MMRSRAVPRPATPAAHGVSPNCQEVSTAACEGVSMFSEYWPCAWEVPEAVDLAPSQAEWCVCSAERWLSTGWPQNGFNVRSQFEPDSPGSVRVASASARAAT